MSRISVTTDELSTLKEEFLASLNHEIRTPLSGVLGMVDLLLETTLTTEQKEYVDDARLCAENLLAILDSTLEFSALSADQVTLAETDFSLRALLNGSLTAFASKAEAKGLKLTWQYASEVPEIAFGDAVQLQQILSHLVTNAIKFTSQGGVDVSIHAVGVKETGFTLKLAVRDTGIGIAEDKLDHIFDSFRQLETGLARRYTGMGLGLAVTRKLVSLMNGELTVSSSLGQGSKFEISIPLSAAREQTSMSRPEPGGSGLSWILVVEDNQVAQTVAVHALQRGAYQVDCASSGAAAVEAAEKNPYGLILMDLHMPEMDGLETAVRIRNLTAHAKTPIVALTANCSPEYRDVCFQHGMQGFLSKPVQAAELLKTVETFLPSSNGAGVHPSQTGSAGDKHGSSWDRPDDTFVGVQ